MIRRSRITVRPNLRPISRIPTQDVSVAGPPSSRSPTTVGGDAGTSPGSGEITPVSAAEETTSKAELQGGSRETQPVTCSLAPHVEAPNPATSIPPTAGMQRRKRINLLPNLAKPRPAPVPSPKPAPATTPKPAPATTPKPAPATTPKPAPAPTQVSTPTPAPAPVSTPVSSPTPAPTFAPASAPKPDPAPTPVSTPTPAPAAAPTPVSSPTSAPAPTPVSSTTSAPAPASITSQSSSRSPKSPVKTVSPPQRELTSPTPAPPSVPQAPPSNPCQVQHNPRGAGSRRLAGGARKAKAVPPPLAPPKAYMEEPPAASLKERQGKRGMLEMDSMSASQETGSSCSPEEIQTSVSECPPECHPAPSERGTQERLECVSPKRGQVGPHSEKPQPRSTAHIPLALRTLNDPVDRLRLAKAKKLRELLKKEMNKDKLKEKQQRPKMGSREPNTVKDHTKMTMRDLIYYLPATNPMSYIEDEQRVPETVLPSSPKAKPVVSPATLPEPSEGGEEEEDQRVEDEALLAPRVKVADDGSLIIDEESLTVEVLRVQGPNPAEEREPIFERGSTTTYSSFRKGTYTKPWSSQETDMFFLAISMVGTDFSMIGQLFPHRARIEIKNKFKKEERANSWRIDKAFKERRRLDLEFFSDLLKKILKDEDNKRKRKKKKSRNASTLCVPQDGSAAKKRKVQSSCSEEESSDGDMMEGEKENEDVCNDGGLADASTRPRVKIAGASSKKSKQTNRPAELDDTDDEGAENSSPVDRSQEPDLGGEKGETSAVQPAQLQSRAQRQLPAVGRRWGGRGLAVRGTAPAPGLAAGHEGASGGPSEEEERRYMSDVISCGLGDSEEEEEPNLMAIQEHIFNRPTRSGRIPKLSQHVIRAAANEEEEEEEGPSTAPPSGRSHTQCPLGPGHRARVKSGLGSSRGMSRRGRTHLVTLLASATEEEEEEEEEEECSMVTAEEESQAFVPMGLRSVAPVSTEVEETMEELDISVNVPDVLGISHNAVCPESLCKSDLSPSGAVPCEHQLDLLVDVIAFLTPENMEVSEESYTEAARTLLTIGHAPHVTPTAEPITKHVPHMTPTAEPIASHMTRMTLTAEPIASHTTHMMPTAEPFASHKTHVTPVAEPPSTDEDIILEESSGLPQQGVQQVVLSMTDQSEARLGTSHGVTSDPCIHVISECRSDLNPVGDLHMGNRERVGSRTSASEPTAQQVFTFMEEPIISQEIHLLLDDGQSGDSSHDPSLSPAPRHTQMEEIQPVTHPALALSPLAVESLRGSAEPPLGPSTEPHRVPGEVGATLVLNAQPGPRVRGSCPEWRAPGMGDGGRVRHPLETLPESGGEHRVGVGEQGQPSHSVSVSHTDPCGSESSVQPSQALRRFRGPKPKPNVIHLSRTTRTNTLQEMTTAAAEPNISQTGGGPHVTPEEQEVAVDSIMAEVSEAVISTETMETGGEEAVVRTLVEPSGSIAEVTCDDLPLQPDPAPDEPIFILSLTEVPPTAVKGEEHEAKPLPLHAVPELASQSLSTPIMFNLQSPTVEGTAPKHAEPLLSSAARGSGEETDHPAKQFESPKRTRRAKLQVKPNPARRKMAPRLLSDKTSDTTPSSALEATPAAETISDCVKDPSSSSTKQTKSPLPRPLSPRPSSGQSSATSSPNGSVATPLPQSVSVASSSQSIVRLQDLREMEAVGMETAASGSGVESQPVCQVTPVVPTGPLTRSARRPRGFLSFMSSGNSLGSSLSTRASQKPHPVNTGRATLARLTTGRVTPASRPSRATLSPGLTQPPSPPPPRQCETLDANPRADEPTSVSAYYFNDIFTIVDEQELTESRH